MLVRGGLPRRRVAADARGRDADIPRRLMVARDRSARRRRGLPKTNRPQVRVVAAGRALQDEGTLEGQGWPADATRRGAALRCLVVPAPRREDDAMETDEKARLLAACDALARDRAFDLSDGPSGRRVRVNPAARGPLVRALACHAKGAERRRDGFQGGRVVAATPRPPRGSVRGCHQL